jgi:putative transposase
MLQRIEAFKVEYRPLRFPVVDQMPTPAWSARWRRRCRGRAGSGAEPITPRNLACRVPKSAQPWVLTLLRTIFDQPDAAQVHAQFDRVVDALSEKFPDAAEHLDTARADLLAFTVFPRELWRQIWSNNPQERLNKEIRRRTDVVGIFPDRPAVVRLVGAVLAEQTDEWTEQRRYMGVEILTRARQTVADSKPQEVMPSTAISA